MHCGSCRQPMTVIEERGVELDRCDTCSTTFFDGGELSEWQDASTSQLAAQVMALAASSAVRGPPCPRCGGRTREIFDPSLAADVCGGCSGVLLRRLKRPEARPGALAAATAGVGVALLDEGSEPVNAGVTEATARELWRLGDVVLGVGDILSALLEGLSALQS